MGQAERRNPFNNWRKTQGTDPFTLYDRFGRPIGAGDVVMFPNQNGDTAWRVVSIKRVPPPPGPHDLNRPTILELTVTSAMVTPCEAGVPLPGILKILDVSESPEAVQKAAADAQAAVDGRPVAPETGSEEGAGAPAEGKIILP